MEFRKALRLLALAGVGVVSAQVYANGPFQLQINSAINASINGYAHPCQDTLGLCYQDGALAPQSPGEGFFLTSSGEADYTTGYLSWRNSNSNNAQSSNGVSAYGPVGLIYDPGSNVAVPIFNQTTTPGTLGFDAVTSILLMAGIDDSSGTGGGGGSSSGGGQQDGGGTDRNYNNWHLCFVELVQPGQLLVSWVLGANLGWPPTNPTCQSINITMVTGAVGYGG
ncbi:hypothetical protein M426DRAFT_265016 [Hypoxylon sp. CI-4A]|nr:hypothetical protein M426DRAFT_265016 [Hypoxylon sp. CI-4A]